MDDKKNQKGGIVIYKASRKEVEIKVRFENESVWLSQSSIAKLFGKDRSVITKHISKIFADKEIDKKSNVQKTHIANSDKPVELYSLDVILAVGYRTNSQRAMHFRKWATQVLKNYLIKGYALNEKRLLETQEKFNYLYKESGEKKINDNALTALALLIAISDPKEKDRIIKIITNLLGPK